MRVVGEQGCALYPPVVHVFEHPSVVDECGAYRSGHLNAGNELRSVGQGGRLNRQNTFCLSVRTWWMPEAGYPTALVSIFRG